MVPDGLLLYSGPLSNPEPGSTENFIAIGTSAKGCRKIKCLGNGLFVTSVTIRLWILSFHLMR